MLLSGENFILTPRTTNMSFVFENLFIDRPGVAEVGFSGAGSKFNFLFSGGRLLDPDNNFVYTCPPNETVTISGDFTDSTYRYYIDNRLASDGKAKPSFGTEVFYTKSTDCQINLGLQMLCPDIPHEIVFDDKFMAGGVLGGKIINYSPIPFHVIESRITHDGTLPNFTGAVTGEVPAGGNLEFSFVDVGNTTSFSDADSTLSLKTTIGHIKRKITSVRTSGFFRNAINLSAEPGLSIISPYFSGSGNYENFTWTPFPTQEQTYNIGYSLLDEDGKEAEKPLYVSLENVSPADQATFTGQYIRSYFTYDKDSHYCTGEAEHGCYNVNGVAQTTYVTKTTCENVGYSWEPTSDMCRGQMHGSGSYSGVPDIEFISYKNVTGVFFNSDNIFSKDTPYKIPMLFSVYPGELGTGASGYFLTESFQINVGTGEAVGGSAAGDGTNWKRITGYEMTNFGTGYTKMPAVVATTGVTSIHNNVASIKGHTTATDPNGVGTGYDLAYTKDVYVYQKFEARTEGDYLAGHLTGIPYFVNTGNNVVGLSGIIITNPGSGYDPTLFKPTIRTVRSSSDPLGTRGSCSDSQYTTQATCEDAGTCSDTQYTTESTCESNGGTWTPTPKVWSDHGDNLSGEFFFNKEGTVYDFGKTWNIETGAYYAGKKISVDFREENLISNNKYESLSWFSPTDEDFHVAVKFNNLDIDEVIESKLTISGSGMIKEIQIPMLNNYSEKTGLGYIPPGFVVSSDGTSFITSYFGG